MKDIQMNDKMVGLAHDIFEKTHAYYDEFTQVNPNTKRASIWIKNDETGQLVVYTRGEHTDKLLEFLSSLP